MLHTSRVLLTQLPLRLQGYSKGKKPAQLTNLIEAIIGSSFRWYSEPLEDFTSTRSHMQAFQKQEGQWPALYVRLKCEWWWRAYAGWRPCLVANVLIKRNARICKISPWSLPYYIRDVSSVLIKLPEAPFLRADYTDSNSKSAEGITDFCEQRPCLDVDKVLSCLEKTLLVNCYWDSCQREEKVSFLYSLIHARGTAAAFFTSHIDREWWRVKALKWLQ